MSRPWTPLFALALAPAFVGCCPVSCGDCLEPTVSQAPKPSFGGGIASLNGFVENRGQWPDEVLFFARRGGVEATVLRDALVFRPMPACEGDAAPAPLILRLPGDPADRAVEGLDSLVTKHHFLVGDRHASDAAGFQHVALRDVLPGVDVILRSDGGEFEYDLVLAPGALLDDFIVEVENASNLEVRDAETLVLHTEVGEVEQRIRASWQGDDREPVPCRFRVLPTKDGRARFGFEAPQWNRALALVLDPSLVWASYVGGTGQDYTVDMEVDATGAAYVLGRSSGGSPVTPGSLQTLKLGATDAWLGKLSPDGATLEWATYLGGTDVEMVAGLELDTDGSLVVFGETWSSNFPTTPGCLQPAMSGYKDYFVSRINSEGTSLVWSTFFGGSNGEIAKQVALYPSGDVLAGGYTLTADVPITAGAYDANFDEDDGLLFRISADGSHLIFSTFFHAGIFDLDVDEQSRIYLGGGGDSGSPTSPDAFQTSLAPGDEVGGYVACLSSDASEVHWGTLLSGSEDSDAVLSLAVDAAGAVYVAGATSSDDLPVTTGAFDTILESQNSGFVAKLLAHGTDLLWCTYLGSSGTCGTPYLALDAAGNVHVAGWSNYPGWPTTPDAYQPSFVGPTPSSDSTLTKLDALGETLVYSTWFGGGSSSEIPWGVSFDGSGRTYLATGSAGPNTPVTPGAYQTTFKGNGDHHVAVFEMPMLPWRVLGGGLKGTQDVPNLAGVGSLLAGAPTRLVLRGAGPLAPGWLVAGFSTISLPFLGGTLMPYPTIAAPVFATSAGALEVTFPWPSLIPGTTLIAQAWLYDPGAPQGWSSSNGLQMIAH